MTQIMVDIEFSLEAHELKKFKELAEELNLSVPETMVLCMTERRDQYLDNFENNTPTSQEKSLTEEFRDTTR